MRYSNESWQCPDVRHRRWTGLGGIKARCWRWLETGSASTDLRGADSPRRSPRERVVQVTAALVASGQSDCLVVPATLFLCGVPVKPPRSRCKSRNMNVTQGCLTYTSRRGQRWVLTQHEHSRHALETVMWGKARSGPPEGLAVRSWAGCSPTRFGRSSHRGWCTNARAYCRTSSRRPPAGRSAPGRPGSTRWSP